MCSFHMLLGILCFVVVAQCDTNREGKSTVKFLLSDAKEPDFDLEEFQDKAPSEGDSETAESIILPTLNYASHPYAVVVLPDLNKFSSLNFGQNEADLEGDIDGSSDIIRAKKSDTVPSSQERITKISLASDEITVFPIVQANGEKIDLSSYGKQFAFINDSSDAKPDLGVTLFPPSESTKGSATGNNLLKSLNLQDSASEYVDSESSAATDNDITTNVAFSNLPGKISSSQEQFEARSNELAIEEDNQSSGRLFSDNKFKVSEASLERKSRIILKGYPRKEGDLLFSPAQVSTEFDLHNSEDNESPAKLSTALLSDENLSLISSESPPNFSVKQALPIQTLPLVNQFSLIRSVVPPSNDYKPQNLNSVTKNQFETIEKARFELLPLINIRNKQQFSESADEESQVLNNENVGNVQFQTILDGSDSFEQGKPNFGDTELFKGVTPTVNLLRINDNIGGLTKNNILGKSVVQQRIPLNELTTAVNLQSIPFGQSNENSKISSEQSSKLTPSLNSNTFDESENGNISPEIKEIIHPLLLQILTNSSSVNGSFASNLLEFMRRLPLPDVGDKDSTSSTPLKLNTLQNNDPISSEQSEQIKQLIKLRNQLSLLDTTTFITTNLKQASSNELNPERSIGSFKLDNPKVEGIASMEAEDSDKKRVPDNSQQTTQYFYTSSKDAETPKKDDLFEKGILKNKSNEGTVLNWSNFVTDSKEGNTGSTLTKKSNERFNELESIKRPVKSPLDINFHQEINPNKTFNVVMEKFDASNAIPEKYQSETPSNENEDNIEQNNSIEHLQITDSSKGFEFQETPVLSEKISNVLVNKNSPRSIYSEESPLSLTPQPYKLPGIYQAYGNSNELPKAKIYEASSTSINLLPSISIDAKYTTATFPLKDSSETEYDPFKQIETIQVYAQDSAKRLSHVTESTHYAEPFTTALVSTQYPDHQIEPRTVTPLSDYISTSPVRQASIKPTTIITTSYMIHNVLTLDTITKSVTVTVTKPSAVFFTETDIIKQTEFITVTKTVTDPRQYTLPVSRLNPSSIDSPPFTLTKLVNSVSTVTHTLYSTVCGPESPDYVDPVYYTPLNNYGINPKNLINNPSYAEARTTSFRRQEREHNQERNQHFDEFNWPKKSKVWPNGFDVDNYVAPSDSEEMKRKLYNYPSSDLGAEDSSVVMMVALPDGKQFSPNERTSRSRKFNHQALVYGTPFYGYKPKSYIHSLGSNGQEKNEPESNS